MKRIILILFICLTFVCVKGQDQTLISNVRKISATEGGFTGQLEAGDMFGFVEAIGDVNGDGIDDMAVGSPWDDDGGTDYGAVYILFLNQDRTVKSQQKISATQGNFTGTMSASDRFGLDIAALGDFDGDGVPDIAVGANVDYDGGANGGAVWMLFLNRDGTVKSHQKISASQGGLVGLTASRQFGYGVTSLGDLDGDGITDIAVGSPTYDNDGGLYRGCVWILFLNSNGTVKAQQKINDFQGGFDETLNDEDRFGASIANMGDIDGDGVVDIVVGSKYDNDGVYHGGAAYVLLLNNDGTVKHTQKISSLKGNFLGTISEGDQFGTSVANLGDIDGDGINDLLTSSYLSDDCGVDAGKLWIIYLYADGSVKGYDEINCESDFLSDVLESGDNFGESLTVLSDSQSGSRSIAVSAKGDDDGAINAGAVYILDLDVAIPEPEFISNVRKISATEGGFNGQLDAGDQFGYVEAIGDVDGDGIDDMAVGAPWDDDGGTDYGAVYILFLNQDRTVKSQQKISATQGNFTGKMSASDRFGVDIAALGDFDGDGVPDIAVGANADYDGGANGGAVWMLFLNRDGTVKSHQKISASQGGLVGLTASRQFGYGVTSLGDLDGDGIIDIAVGSPTYDNDGGLYRGCVWILFLNSNGTVKAQQKINDFQGGFTGVLDDKDRFGATVINMGDINDDGVVDIAVYAMMDDDGATDAGAIYMLFLNKNGTVQMTQKISAIEGNFKGTIEAGDNFGVSIVNLGDLDGDGINDMFVGSPRAGINKDTTRVGQGYIMFLNNDGTVKNYENISAKQPNLSNVIQIGDWFGTSASCFNGYSSNGKKELIVGAVRDDAGAVYILDLDVKFKPVAIAGEDIMACANAEYAISGNNSTVFDNDTMTYSWECLENKSLNNELSTFTFNAPDVVDPARYHFILTVTCQGQVSDPDTVTVTVNPQPKTAVSQINGLLHTIHPSFEGYQWFLGDMAISGANSREYAPVQDGYYTVVVTNSYGCSSEPTDSFYVQVAPIAVASGTDSLCAGSVIDLGGALSHLPDGSTEGLSYQWSCLNMSIEGNSSSSLSLYAPDVDAVTRYDFVLQVTRGDGLVSDYDTLSVFVKPSPKLPVIEQYGDTLLAPSSYSYLWYLEGVQIFGENDSILVISKSGNYQVKLFNTYGCTSNISAQASFIYSSVDVTSNLWKVYPNPVADDFYITGFNGKATITLADMDGKVCLSKEISSNEAVHAGSLERGIYLLQVTTEGVTVIKKLMKQ